MKKIKAIITTIWMAFPLLGTSQNNDLPQIQWNAIKVFDLGLDQVYNLYIDTLGFNGVETVICFQTKTGQLIKTDFDGTILSAEKNPYTYFACSDGDSLIIDGYSIVNEKGETLNYVIPSDYCSYITVSKKGVYVFAGYNHSVVGYIAGFYKKTFNKMSSRFSANIMDSDYISGLCYSDGLIFNIICTSIPRNYLEYRKVSDPGSRTSRILRVNNPAGIGAYGDFLYVYSNTDKALYRLETPDGIGISALITEPEEEPEEEDDEEEDYSDTIYPLNMDFIPAPNKMFVKKVPGVTNDYIVSLLDEQLNDKYHITGWYGDFCKVDVVEDSLIDGAITELLKSDSVAITRRILYFRPDYEFFIEHGYPIDEYCEICVFNGVSYHIRRGYTQNTVDSLANVYGLTNTPDKDKHGAYGSLSAPKTADIFDIAQKLYDTECFTYISLDMHMKINMHETSIRKIDSEQKEILETQYYNLSGQRIGTPSGLTIVVTRYSDGAIRTEKKLY